MKQEGATIHDVALLSGILPEYRDAFGVLRTPPPETTKIVLAQMGIDAGFEETIRAALDNLLNREWTSPVEPVYVISQHAQPFSLPVSIPLTEGAEKRLIAEWSFEDENGSESEFSASGDELHVTGEHHIGDLRYVRFFLRGATTFPLGYYSVSFVFSHPSEVFPGGRTFFRGQTRVIVTPDQCYLPDDTRTWGVSLNLYAVRSSRNWGVGDFTDLQNMLSTVASLGGGFVGINPLHTTPNSSTSGVSPYAPLSRVYKNFLYLDPERIADFRESEAARSLFASEEFSAALARARESETIDYDAVAGLKRAVLRACFDHFESRHYRTDSARGASFKMYLQDQGEMLDSYALFMALWEDLNARSGITNWQEWPAELRSSESRKVAEFRAAHSREILFHKYLQWLIDIQHQEAHDEASGAGMHTGIYHDLAVGAIGGGAHAWRMPGTVAEEVEIGAPPDEFSLQGQKWGIRPMIPQQLRATGYDLFARTLRENMRWNGALRIDHALGLFRLFWVPQGMSAVDGAYVKYPTEDLLRIIALESVRNRTVIIAEDLGTVGEEVHATLERFRILSYRVLYFERKYPDPAFVSPDQYPELALCTATTHDLPTLPGYWTDRDIGIKKSMGLFRDSAQADQYERDRARDKRLLLEALKNAGVLHPSIADDMYLNSEMSDSILLSIYRFLGKTPCRFIAASLDDLLGNPDQQNLPGASDPYPNWKRKTLLTVEEISSQERLKNLAKMFAEEVGSGTCVSRGKR